MKWFEDYDQNGRSANLPFGEVVKNKCYKNGKTREKLKKLTDVQMLAQTWGLKDGMKPSSATTKSLVLVLIPLEGKEMNMETQWILQNQTTPAL